MLENDVVFGGEKLYKAILELGRYRPKAIFVYATCVTADRRRHRGGLPGPRKAYPPHPCPGFIGTRT
jgi:hypothetical protein